uniref:CCHC-type domain-containing protein n=1 Tax=Macrostomum lignano TaxID=282301 RepID=A0A1I8JCG7_9PLAT
CRPPAFNGDWTQWTAFWDRFSSSIHDNPSLSVVEKFSYLQSCLSGEAKNSIAGRKITAENYKIDKIDKIDNLQRRFGSRSGAVREHLAKFSALTCSGASVHQLRNFHDQVNGNVRSLENLGANQGRHGICFADEGYEGRQSQSLIVTLNMLRRVAIDCLCAARVEQPPRPADKTPSCNFDTAGSGKKKFEQSATQSVKSHEVKTMAMVTKVQTVVLPTAGAVLISPDGCSETRVRILFDSASNRSFILSGVAERMGLCVIGKETMEVTTFGGTKPKVVQTEKIDFQLRVPPHSDEPERSWNSEERAGTLTAAEVSEAKERWLKEVQRRSFSAEIAHFKRSTASTDLAKQLNLFLDSKGLLQSRGRLRESNVVAAVDCPILIPNKTHLEVLLIRDAHSTLCKLHEKFWLIRGRQRVKAILGKCVVCRRLQGLPFAVMQVPALPESRLKAMRAFEWSRLDYCGPVKLRKDTAVEKGYMLVFTCAATRALHLELRMRARLHAFWDCWERQYLTSLREHRLNPKHGVIGEATVGDIVLRQCIRDETSEIGNSSSRAKARPRTQEMLDSPAGFELIQVPKHKPAKSSSVEPRTGSPIGINDGLTGGPLVHTRGGDRQPWMLLDFELPYAIFGARHRKFEATLDERLRDQLVRVHRAKLLEVAQPDFKTLVARVDKAAKRSSSEMAHGAEAVAYLRLHKNFTAPKAKWSISTSPRKAPPPISSQRYADSNCHRRVHSANCQNCGKVGHIRKVCRNSKLHKLDPEPAELQEPLFIVCQSGSSKSLTVELRLQGKPCLFEVTGSALTVIPKSLQEDRSPYIADIHSVADLHMPELYPMPRIEDVFAKLDDGCKWSKLDRSNVFLQLPFLFDTINSSNGKRTFKSKESWLSAGRYLPLPVSVAFFLLCTSTAAANSGTRYPVIQRTCLNKSLSEWTLPSPAVSILHRVCHLLNLSSPADGPSDEANSCKFIVDSEVDVFTANRHFAAVWLGGRGEQLENLVCSDGGQKNVTEHTGVTYTDEGAKMDILTSRMWVSDTSGFDFNNNFTFLMELKRQPKPSAFIELTDFWEWDELEVTRKLYIQTGNRNLISTNQVLPIRSDQFVRIGATFDISMTIVNRTRLFVDGSFIPDNQVSIFYGNIPEIENFCMKIGWRDVTGSYSKINGTVKMLAVPNFYLTADENPINITCTRPIVGRYFTMYMNASGMDPNLRYIHITEIDIFALAKGASLYADTQSSISAASSVLLAQRSGLQLRSHMECLIRCTNLQPNCFFALIIPGSGDCLLFGPTGTASGLVASKHFELVVDSGFWLLASRATKTPARGQQLGSAPSFPELYSRMYNDSYTDSYERDGGRPTTALGLIRSDSMLPSSSAADDVTVVSSVQDSVRQPGVPLTGWRREYVSQKRTLSSAPQAASNGSLKDLREENACLQHDMDALVRAVKSAQTTGRWEFDRGKFLALDPDKVFDAGSRDGLNSRGILAGSAGGVGGGRYGHHVTLAEPPATQTRHFDPAQRCSLELGETKERLRQMQIQLEDRDSQLMEQQALIGNLQSRLARHDGESAGTMRNLSALDEKLRRAGQEIAQYERRIQSLEAELREARDQRQRDSEELASARQSLLELDRVDVLESELKRRDDVIGGLRMDVARTHEAKEQLLVEHNSLRSKLVNLESSLKKKEAELNSSTARCQDLQQQLADARRQLDSASRNADSSSRQEATVARLRTENESLRAQQQELQDQVKRLTDSLQKLQASSKETRDALTAEIAERHDSLLRLKAEAKSLEEKYNDAVNVANQRSEMLKQVRAELASAGESAAEAQDRLRRNDAASQQWQRQREDALHELEALRLRCAELERGAAQRESAWKGDRTELQAACRRLTDQLEARDAAIEQLQTELEASEAERRAELDAARRREAELAGERQAEAAAAAEAARATTQRLEDAIRAARAESGDARRRAEELERALDEERQARRQVGAEARDFAQRLQASEAEAARANEEVARLGEKLREAGAESKRQSDSVARLQESLSRAKTEIDDLKQRAQEDIAQRDKSIQQLQADLLQSQSQYTGCYEELLRSEEEVGQLRASLQRSQSNGAQAANEARQLDARLRECQTALESARRDCQAREAGNEQLRARMRELESELRSTEAGLEETAAELERTHEAGQRVAARCRDQEAELHRMSKQLQQLQSELNSVRENLKRLEAESAAQADTARRQLASAQEALAETREELADQRERRAGAEREADRLQQCVQQLQLQLAGAHQQMKSERSRYQEISNRLEAANERADQSEEALSAAKADQQQLESALARCRAELQTAARDRDSATAEVDRMKRAAAAEAAQTRQKMAEQASESQELRSALERLRRELLSAKEAAHASAQDALEQRQRAEKSAVALEGERQHSLMLAEQVEEQDRLLARLQSEVRQERSKAAENAAESQRRNEAAAAEAEATVRGLRQQLLAAGKATEQANDEAERLRE